jgi:hypothetical protein
MVTPIEAEGNEYYQGRYKEGMIKGPSHEAGGVNMLAVEGDFIYPRKYAKQGQAIRSEILRIENKMKRLENKLAKASNPTLAKNTYERTFNKVKDELQELYQTEEALKQQIVAEKEAKEAAKLGVQQPEMQEQLPEEAMYDLGGFVDPRYNLLGVLNSGSNIDPTTGLALPYSAKNNPPASGLTDYMRSIFQISNPTTSVGEPYAPVFKDPKQIFNEFKLPAESRVFSKNSYTNPKLKIDPRTGFRGVVKVSSNSNVDPTTGFKVSYGSYNSNQINSVNQTNQSANQNSKSPSNQPSEENEIKPPSFQVGDIGVGLNSLIPAAYNLYQSMQPTAQYNFGRVRPIDYIPLSPEQALRDQRIATSTAANMNTRMPAGMRSGMLANLQAGALKGMQDTRFAYDQQNVQNRNQVNQMNAQIQGQNIALSMQERQLADAANAARQQFGSTGFSQLGNVFGGIGSAMNQRQQGQDLMTIAQQMANYFEIGTGPDGKPILKFKPV